MKKNGTLLPTLPIEIFQHIFVYLPVKSLVRFHGICREWNDVINEPNFVRMHLHHAKQCNSSQKLMIYSYRLHEYHSLDHQTISGDDDIQAFNLHYPINGYNIPLPKITTIAGSVNGLVCIWYATNFDKSSTILVWNPSIKVHKVLPPHPDSPVTGMDGIGFGYNSATNDYNVVRVLNRSRIDIYSLKTNSWKLVMSGKGIPPHSRGFHKRFRVCCMDGLIYWIACHISTDGRIIKDLFIACFDLKEVDDDKKKKKKNKLIREIPMPRDFGMEFAFAELKVMGGYLSLFKVSMCFGPLEIWSMMKINGNKNEQVECRWIKRVVIRDAFSSPSDILSARFILPICLSEDGKIVIRVPHNTPNELALYNSDTKSIENLHPIHWMNKIGGRNVWGKVPIEESHMYIETLVSPNFIYFVLNNCEFINV